MVAPLLDDIGKGPFVVALHLTTFVQGGGSLPLVLPVSLAAFATGGRARERGREGEGGHGPPRRRVVFADQLEVPTLLVTATFETYAAEEYDRKNPQLNVEANVMLMQIEREESDLQLGSQRDQFDREMKEMREEEEQRARIRAERSAAAAAEEDVAAAAAEI